MNNLTSSDVTEINDVTKTNNIGKVICVGRNYAEHALELGNDVPDSPMLFMKPSSAVVSVEQPIKLPDFGGHTHFEAELCVQLGKDLHNASLDEVKSAISGVTIGLDLTLRELQNKLKTKGHPWERSKAFAGSCVLGDWVSVDDCDDNCGDSFGYFTSVQYEFYLNDELRQSGDTSLMMFPIYELLVDISHAFGLQAGDVVMTGTPKGVGELASGDVYRMVLLTGEVDGGEDNKHEWQGQIA